RDLHSLPTRRSSDLQGRGELLRHHAPGVAHEGQHRLITKLLVLGERRTHEKRSHNGARAYERHTCIGSLAHHASLAPNLSGLLPAGPCGSWQQTTLPGMGASLGAKGGITKANRARDASAAQGPLRFLAGCGFPAPSPPCG